MELAKIRKVTGRGVPVAGDDIDTDRIIPARFMKCVTFDGLGEFLFYDVRKTEEGEQKEHPLNAPEFSGANILISGNNFGCGSSREHAPQAIYRAGFRAVVAEGFAEIFFGNSTNLGIPCVSVLHEHRLALQSAVREQPEMELEIDLESRLIQFGKNAFPFELREGARMALINGKWDPLGELLEGIDAVEQKARELAYL